jgi:site-specific DNA recombinase
MEEYQRRLAHASSLVGFEAERKQVALARKRVKAQEDRLTDAYLNEAIDLERYTAEMGKLRVRRDELERAAQDVGQRERQTQDAKKALASLETFCHRASTGLDAMTFEERRQLLRLVVERITVEDAKVRVEAIIPIDGDKVQLRTRHPEALEA